MIVYILSKYISPDVGLEYRVPGHWTLSLPNSSLVSKFRKNELRGLHMFA